MARARAATEESSPLSLNVEFGNVSVGDKTARIGITVDRSSLKIAEADKKFCERRISGTIKARANGDHPDQGTFAGMDDSIEMKSIFDVKGFAVSQDHISFGATFALGEIEVGTLAAFAKKTGRLIVHESNEIEDDRDDSDSDDE